MPSRRIEDVVAAVAAAVVAVAVALLAPPPTLPAFVPEALTPAYAAASPAAVVLVEPVAHAPWIDVPPPPLAVLIAALVTASLWSASASAGATIGSSTIMFVALLSREDLRVPLTLGAPAALGLGLVWASVVLLTRAPSGRRVRIWGAALAGAGAAAWPPLLVVLPAVAVCALQRGWLLVVATGASVIAGVAAGLAVWAARATRLSTEAVSLADVVAAVTDATPRGAGPFVWPPMGDVVLPGVLALIGGLVLAGRSSWGTRIGLALAALAPAAALIALPSWRDEISRAVLWTAWPLAAAGLTWIVRRMPSRLAAPATVVVGALLVAGGVLMPQMTARVAPAAFARELQTALDELAATQPLSIVAGNPRLDTALVAWGSGRAMERSRIHPRLVDEARADGRTVLAAPTARAALELWGLQFIPGVTIESSPPFTLAEVTGRLRCVPVTSPWRELPGLEYTGRLGVHVPKGEGRLEAVVVGPPPLAPRLVAPDGRAVGVLGAVPMHLPSLPPVLWPGDGRLPDASLRGVRIALDGQLDQAQSASLALGQRAPLVAVRYVSPASDPTVATVCAAPLPRDEPASVSGVPLDDDTFFAGGWGAAMRLGGVVARDAGARAVALLPAASGGARMVALRARPRPATNASQLSLSVNGWNAAGQPMTAGDHDYRWSIPDGVWVAGTNEVVFDVTATGFTATSLRIERP